VLVKLVKKGRERNSYLYQLLFIPLFSASYLKAWYCNRCIAFVLVQRPGEQPRMKNVSVYSDRIYIVSFKKN